MNRRAMSLALACALSISLLSACGGKDNSSASAPVSGGSSASASASDVSVPDLSQPDASVPDADQPDTSSPSQSAPAVDEPTAVASLSLNKSDFTLKSAGATYQLKAALSGTEDAVVWVSSDEAVATVAEDGTVTAVAPGSSTITASCGDMSAQCIVRCDWKEQSETPDGSSDSSTPSAASVDLNAFVASLAAKHGENFAANANVVEFGMHTDLYPGISDIAANQLVIYQPMMGAVVCEIALAEVTNSADVDAMKALFQARIDAQVQGGAWYPESIEGWKNNSRIVTNGNYVMMIAWQFCDDAVSDFNGLF